MGVLTIAGGIILAFVIIGVAGLGCDFITHVGSERRSERLRRAQRLHDLQQGYVKQICLWPTEADAEAIRRAPEETSR